MDVEKRLRIFKILLEIVILVVGFLALVSNLDTTAAIRESQETSTVSYKEIMKLISEQNQQIDKFATTCAIHKDNVEQ